MARGLFSLQARVAERAPQQCCSIEVPRDVLRAAGLEDGGAVDVRLLG